MSDFQAPRKRRLSVSREPLENGLVLFGTSPYYTELSERSFEMAKALFKKALVDRVVLSGIGLFVHEYTHFAVHNHGPDFRALMDLRLPGWQLLRKRLNKRDWGPQVV